MSDIVDDLKHVLHAQDDARPRTQQVEIGPSSLGGCRRRVMYEIRGEPEVNPTERLASMMGTAIHNTIEQGWREHGDPTDQVEVEVPGLPEIGLGPGHIDLYRPKQKRIVDWKTSKLKSQPWFPKSQQRWQVQVYGLLARLAGLAVDRVTLVSIARDGTFDDIQVHDEVYSEEIAYQATDWLANIWNAKDDLDYLPPAEMPPNFCKNYCPFYSPVTLCPGKTD